METVDLASSLTGPPSAAAIFLAMALALASITRGGLVPEALRATALVLTSGLPLVGAVWTGALRRRPSGSRGLLIYAVAFSVVQALARLAARGTDTSIESWMAPIALTIGAATVGSLLDERDLRFVFRVLTLIAVIQAILAVWEVQIGAEWARQIAIPWDGTSYPQSPNRLVEGIWRARGTTGHPILLGLVCGIGGLMLYSGESAVKNRLVRAVAFVGCVWGVLLSGSRSAVIAMGVGIVAISVHKKNQMPRILRAGVFLSGIVATAMFAVSSVTEAAAVAEFSLENRVASLDHFRELLRRPVSEQVLGSGPDFFGQGVLIDNQIVEAFASAGWTGLLLFAAATVTGVRSKRPVVSGVGAFLAFMTLSFNTILWNFPALLFWFAMGVASRRRAPGGVGVAAGHTCDPRDGAEHDTLLIPRRSASFAE